MAALCATVLLALSACATKPPAPTRPPVVTAPPPPVAKNPLDRDQASFLRLPGLPDGTPVRVGVILPLSSSSPATPPCSTI